MSTTVFDFLLVKPFKHLRSHRTVVVQGNFGHTVTRDDGGLTGQYRAQISVLFPGPAYDYDDWLAFLEGIRGAWDTWLFKDPIPGVRRSSTDEALGTGNGVLTDFALDMKYVDASSLVVYKGGVEQTTGWSLINNNTTPTVRFTAAPASGAITATYDFYYPVRFVADPDPGEWRSGADQFICGPYEILEEYDGAHVV